MTAKSKRTQIWNNASHESVIQLGGGRKNSHTKHHYLFVESLETNVPTSCLVFGFCFCNPFKWPTKYPDWMIVSWG